MLIRRPSDISSVEITPEGVYHSSRQYSRRQLLSAGAIGALGLAAGPARAEASPRIAALDASVDPLTPERIITSYNNFYEFGMDKRDPARYAHELTTRPWPVEIAGECARPGVYDFDDVISGLVPEERIYRLRCVEAWSMVVPWLGIPLRQILERYQPNGHARFVEFTTLERPAEMRGQRARFSGIDWPYVEGLRLDEALHPLTIMATGLYGKPLPNQNGAPWRLVVPWKYGFKSSKSIVRIRFTRRQPENTWQRLAPQEYGFYANVNPEVDHPRWSQASERRLPTSLLGSDRRPTLMFNGYGDQVAALYAGMDLRKLY
jgi:sulfoxide reductase catalytic subunit YedY